MQHKGLDSNYQLSLTEFLGLLLIFFNSYPVRIEACADYAATLEKVLSLLMYLTYIRVY